MKRILLMPDPPAGGSGEGKEKTAPETKAKTIYVKANEPISEDGFHAKGEIFEVEAKRAKALGKVVTEVKAKKDEDGKLVEITD